MSVKLELYRTFQEVAKTENISLAAQNLYISQSAVSQAIRQLEDQLQVRLFSRSTKGVKLTGEGRMLAEYVTHALGLLESGEEKIAQARSLQTGELVIGASDTVTKTYLLSRLEAFHKAHPGIRIRIRNGTSRLVLEYLNTGAVDIAFATEPKNSTAYSCRRCIVTHTMFVSAPDYFPDPKHCFTMEEVAAADPAGAAGQLPCASGGLFPQPRADHPAGDRAWVAQSADLAGADRAGRGLRDRGILAIRPEPGRDRAAAHGFRGSGARRQHVYPARRLADACRRAFHGFHHREQPHVL